MEKGYIVEFIDRQKIICAVVLEIKDKRLRLLTESNREVKISSNRLLPGGKESIDISAGREKMADMLRATARRRNALARDIDIKELWDVLNGEQEWIDLETMTALCFPVDPTADHESAVIRAFFGNRFHFKFDQDRFFPHSEEQVAQRIAREEEAARIDQMTEAGGNWLKSILDGADEGRPEELSSEHENFIRILKSLYLFEQDSEDHAVGKGILSRAGMNDVSRIFPVLVNLGVFDKDENTDLLRLRLPLDFSDSVEAQTKGLLEAACKLSGNGLRKDMTALPLMTIDGQGTLDYDDAISIEKRGDQYFIGVHIIDVGHFIKKGDPIDQEACSRGSSTYMPDRKIPMLPPQLAEGLCSLRASEIRPAISIMAKLGPAAEILDFEVFPSIVSVKQQLTYYDVNLMADENPDILMLRDIAHSLRKGRLARGAIQIWLPDINVMIGDEGEVIVSTINRDSPARVIVEELMILANGLMARFLAEHGMPAVFRSQPDPRERLYRGNNGTLYQNYAQRKLLSRVVLGNTPERHAGLGTDAYVTATSPIRKYFDLVTQRQIRAIFDLETPYSADDLNHLLQILEVPMSNVMGVQMRRKRYWLLKYLEDKIGGKHQAIVLHKRRNSYQVLIPDYMLECTLAATGGLELKPEDLVQITLQHVHARNGSISIFWG